MCVCFFLRSCFLNLHCFLSCIDWNTQLYLVPCFYTPCLSLVFTNRVLFPNKPWQEMSCFKAQALAKSFFNWLNVLIFVLVMSNKELRGLSLTGGGDVLIENLRHRTSLNALVQCWYHAAATHRSSRITATVCNELVVLLPLKWWLKRWEPLEVCLQSNFCASRWC